MQQNNLEYVLSVKTPNYGPIEVLFRDGGRRLEFAKAGDPSFYKLLGVVPPHEVEIGNDMIRRIKDVKPDWKIPLHGEWQNIGEVVERLYSQVIDRDCELESVSHDNFFSRNSILITFGTAMAVILPLAVPVAISPYTNISWQASYSVAAPFFAVILGGFIYCVRRLCVERDRETKPFNDSIASLRELEAAREGIIRAGVLNGTFPEDYGLPK